ncbi:MAG: preprotein translocase subunit SecA [Elusimicrobia bacterium]|nr:preprotein translocase subunit SecA [Elusimicrobiota bacterium]MDD7579217.1 preprotein translocase subunit SecA [Elusimicrobiota bacterium]MDY6039681.1 preprotein translocase subunit SecA [Elusimicrobiaceae bacterium]
MIRTVIDKIFGTKSERDLKKIQHYVDAANKFTAEFEKLSDDELKAKTQEFKKRLADGQTLDDILSEAFAVARLAAQRVIGLRPYDVQMLGGIVLHQGKIAEMGTGEGKTLVAVLPSYLNALTGKGVHVVTVNDYLARRDRQWMGPIHEFLGLTVGYISHDMTNAERREMYAKDITYVTNNELGFDYLRDNMVISREDRVLRPLNYCIVDEVDSILIDEARTPLIISGPSDQSTDKYYIVNRLIPSLKVRLITEKDEVKAKYEGIKLDEGVDAVIDEKAHTATLTDTGIAKAEKFLNVQNLYNDVESEWVHHINQALRAHHLYEKDVDYVIKDGEVIIVDEFTGRLMPGRRWSDGLHQAVEAKEGLQIKEENQTLATITFQNFFKLYKKLSGMTGTAMTEANEFWQIYKLDVVEIRPNRPSKRRDFPDLVYLTEREKFNAIVEEVESLWKKGAPVLVGTRSIEKSEKLSHMLRAKGIPHKVLNAKYHEMEAQIISQAGRKGAVTIATNMAGRGTDIVLGGSPADPKEQQEVVNLEGLHVIGSERHESRRIDNQLRGRCARQGDPGCSRFYISLEDELMRLFANTAKISAILSSMGMKEGEAIESRLMTRQIEGAQRMVEGRNFDIRKQLLDYDKVMNQQRTAIYGLRNAILDGENMTEKSLQMMEEIVDELVEQYYHPSHPQKSDFETLNVSLRNFFPADFAYTAENVGRKSREAFADEIIAVVKDLYNARVLYFTEQGINFAEIERMLLLQLLDSAWKQNLYELDQLQSSVSLRGYAQKDPLIEYQKESYKLYSAMLNRVRDMMVGYIFRLQLPPRRTPAQRAQEGDAARHAESGTPVSKNIGRNDPCPCGSGKKYKKCCGANL